MKGLRASPRPGSPSRFPTRCSPRRLRLIASGFADAGFDVDIAPLFQTPEEVASLALDHDVHAVGISTQAGAHLTLVPALSEALRSAERKILLVCGGIVPAADHEALERAGVAAIFGPATPVIDAIEQVLQMLQPLPAETVAPAREPPIQPRADA